MKRVLISIVLYIILPILSFAARNPTPIDSRIKTLVYSSNEIFQVKFITGYQSIMEFESGEEIEMIAFGDPSSWSVKAFSNRLFIQATDPSVKTNMTLITNKRTYLMEISSTETTEDLDDNIALVLRFFYPDINVDLPKKTAKVDSNSIKLNGKALTATGVAGGIKTASTSQLIADTSNINTNYSYIGSKETLIPIMVFDNSLQTFFKFGDMTRYPLINSVEKDGRELPLKIKKADEYLVVDTIEKMFSIRDGGDVVYITNEKNISKDKIQAMNK